MEDQKGGTEMEQVVEIQSCGQGGYQYLEITADHCAIAAELAAKADTWPQKLFTDITGIDS